MDFAKLLPLLLKNMGFKPELVQAQLDEASAKINAAGSSLQRIEEKLDRVLNKEVA